jgi:hypothetical protein
LALFYRANEEEAKYAALMARNKSLTEALINTTEVTIPNVNTHYNLRILVIIAVAVILCGLTRALLFLKVTLGASQNLHNSMFDSILPTGIDFFQKDSITGFLLASL